MSEIKFDKVGADLTPNRLLQPAIKEQTQTIRQEGVTVTHQMDQLVNLLGGEDISPDENTRVLAVKSLVDSGQYKVDVHALSEKLLNSGLLNSGG